MFDARSRVSVFLIISWRHAQLAIFESLAAVESSAQILKISLCSSEGASMIKSCDVY